MQERQDKQERQVQDKGNEEKVRKGGLGSHVLRFNVPVKDYQRLPIPGIKGATLGVCFIRVTDVPQALDGFMEINPRVPSRAKSGVLAGPVIKGILQTLREVPEEMVIKNQGIYILADSMKAANGYLTVHLTDPGKHGIVNGGHTYAAIREALETASEDEVMELKEAFVRLNIYEGIDAELVPEIAEGLNRSKQVDDPSLINLQGEFDSIRKALRGTAAEKAISYHQGDAGEVYISEILVYLAMFDKERFTETRHPNGLYNRQSLALRYFAEDLQERRSNLSARIKLLPDILWLVDSIRKAIPEAARRNSFKFGMAKVGGERLGGKKQSGMMLPFLGERTEYRVPNGWVYPIVAAFRANLGADFKWTLPIDEVLKATIVSLTGVCVSEHKGSGLRPELVGKRESAYSQCHTLMQLYLVRKERR